MSATADEEVIQSAAQQFEALGICSQLAEAAAALKWLKPSPIQEQAIPHLLQGMQVIWSFHSVSAITCLVGAYLLMAPRTMCRPRYHWSGPNWQRQNRSVCFANPPGVAAKLHIIHGISLKPPSPPHPYHPYISSLHTVHTTIKQTCENDKPVCLDPIQG